uniref:Otopetrin 3 n=1 Tax=Sphaeramia orbicularis TaxID=375764 RepID=A0A672ZZE7_9TELE
IGRRLISGLLGLNVVLLGSALVAGQAFNPDGLKHQEPQVFLLVLMGFSLVWMLWYLLWARKQPGVNPHKDHHAGGVTIICKTWFYTIMMKIGYLLSMKECKPAAQVLSPFIEAPFLAIQVNSVYWLISALKCTNNEKKVISSFIIHHMGRIIHLKRHIINGTNKIYSISCLTFRKGYEILYPFNIEYYLMAGCMIYVMWKNVGRRMSPGHHHHHVDQKLTLRIVYRGGIIYGLVSGVLVLVAGVTIFILYQVWVSQPQLRLMAFLLFYGYHLAVMPVMSLCSLVGLLVHRLERRAHEGDHNPTRSLDVILLVAAALGQLALSYFSLVAALAVGTRGTLGDLDLSYSLLSLLELILQNIFIIEGLHRHPSLLAKKKEKQRSSIFKVKLIHANITLMEGNTAPPPAQEHDGKKSWTKTVIQEICAFLILSNIMLWVIPAFGVHPQFENGLGKQFFGFTVWFVLVNLGQPLSVFYRMHSVGALMELLLSA